MKDGKGIQKLPKNELEELRSRNSEMKSLNQAQNSNKSNNIEKKKEVNIVENSILGLKPMVEEIIKNNIEIIILYNLYYKPMCGYELIKEIFLKYNVLLSHGTVYPYLNSLKEKGILQVEHVKGDMRIKKYIPSANGMQIIEKKLDDFIKVEEYFLNSIRKR